MNLMSNAIDASPPNSVVTVSTKRDGNEVQIEVADTGSGIPQKIMDRIFDPFFTTKKQGEGTGLGLSISFGIIKEHGGRIDVASEVGKGSRFTIHLPIEAVIEKKKRDEAKTS
jgi:signal transduction histidine kinase